MKAKTKDKLVEIYRYILGTPKTIYFNFKYFKITDALKFPVIVSHKTNFRHLNGSIKLDVIKTAIVKIGFNPTQTIDFKYDRTILDIQGEIVFKGKCYIGTGGKIQVKGYLEFGVNNNFNKTSIICQKEIIFGDHVLFSWDNLIMDTDQHPITDMNGIILNEDKHIVFGNNVWVGCRCTILKGTNIGNNIMIGANSTIRANFIEENTIVAGNPATIVKRGIKWE